jgi:hypothetical protein
MGSLLAHLASLRVDVSFLVPFAAGNFLYVGASNLVPEVNKQRDVMTNVILSRASRRDSRCCSACVTSRDTGGSDVRAATRQRGRQSRSRTTHVVTPQPCKEAMPCAGCTIAHGRQRVLAPVLLQTPACRPET